MRKLVLIVLAVFLTTPAFAEPPPDFDNDVEFQFLRNNFPAVDDYSLIQSFMTKSIPVNNMNSSSPYTWEYLFTKKRFEAVYLLAKAFHSSFPEKKFRFYETEAYFSPLDLAFRSGNKDLILGLLKSFPEIASISSTNAYGVPVRPPISRAIEADDVPLVNDFIEAGARTDYETYITEDDPLPKNLLSFSRTTTMDLLLTKNGVPKSRKLDRPIKSHITSENVRLRDQPSLDGKVLLTMSKGKVVQIVGNNFKYENIEGKQPFPYDWYCWFEIGVDGKVGWCYGKYVYLFAR